MMDITPDMAEAHRVHAEISRFEQARRGSQELAEVFANPGVEIGDKLEIAATIGGKLELSPLATRFVEVLIRNHRINDLGAILDAWLEMIHQQEGVAVAEVRTAHALDEREQKELAAALSRRAGRKVELRLAEDRSLLGGFVATIGSEVFDASLERQITRFRESLKAQ